MSPSSLASPVKPVTSPIRQTTQLGNGGSLNDPLPPGGDVIDYRITEDGRWVVYLADQEQDDEFEIFVAPLESTATSYKLVPTLNGSDVVQFDIARGLSRIVYRTNEDAVFSIPLAGGDVTSLGNALEFTVTPDGNSVIMAFSSVGFFDIPTTGGNPTFHEIGDPLYTNYRIGRPTHFSPDGRHFYFGSYYTIGGYYDCDNHYATIGEPGVGSTGASLWLRFGRDRVIYTPASGFNCLTEPSPLFSVSIPFGQDRVVLSDEDRSVSQRQVVPAPLDGTEHVVYLEGKSLYRIPIDGSEPRVNLAPAEAGRIYDLVLSPDGRNVAVVVYTQLGVVPIDGGPVRLIELPATGVSVRDMRFSPNGETIAYRVRGFSTSTLYGVAVAGGEPYPLSGPLGLGRYVRKDFTFSADSADVYFRTETDSSDPEELFRVPATGGEAVRQNGNLVSGGNVESFSVLPDGGVVYLADEFVDEQFELILAGAAEVCGDGIIHPMSGEQCDDGNDADNDGCSSVCAVEVQTREGFTARALLNLDGPPPLLEAVRDSRYGAGVLTASTKDGVLTVRRLDAGSPQVLVNKVLPEGRNAGTAGFDTTGIFRGDLFIAPWLDSDLDGGADTTDLLRVPAYGATVVETSLGGPSIPTAALGAFSDGSAGYAPGIYFLDVHGRAGAGVWHVDSGFTPTALAEHSLPEGRDDIDPLGVEFDSAGDFGHQLYVAECDTNGDDLSALYSLGPDLSWTALTSPVPTSVRCFADVSFGRGGALGNGLYAVDRATGTVWAITPDGELEPFATGFLRPERITVADDGDAMFVADENGVYRISCQPTVWHQDADADGFGNPQITALSCAQPNGHVAPLIPDDCDDNSALVYPGAMQLCGDGIGNDCEAASWPLATDERDDDGDGFSECAGDCQDDNPDATLPAAEVVELNLDINASTTSLSWSAPGIESGTTFRVISGDLGAVLQVGTFGDVMTLSGGQTALVARDDRVGPGPGGLYFYLVGSANACGFGTFGDSSLTDDPRDALDARGRAMSSHRRSP